MNKLSNTTKEKISNILRNITLNLKLRFLAGEKVSSSIIRNPPADTLKEMLKDIESNEQNY